MGWAAKMALMCASSLVSWLPNLEELEGALPEEDSARFVAALRCFKLDQVAASGVLPMKHMAALHPGASRCHAGAVRGRGAQRGAQGLRLG